MRTAMAHAHNGGGGTDLVNDAAEERAHHQAQHHAPQRELLPPAGHGGQLLLRGASVCAAGWVHARWGAHWAGAPLMQHARARTRPFARRGAHRAGAPFMRHARALPTAPHSPLVHTAATHLQVRIPAAGCCGRGATPCGFLLQRVQGLPSSASCSSGESGSASAMTGAFATPRLAFGAAWVEWLCCKLGRST